MYRRDGAKQEDGPEETSMDDLGLEVGQALAEAGPGESLGRE